MGIELNVDHASGHQKPSVSHPLLQATTTKPTTTSTASPSVKTRQPTSMPTTLVKIVPYPGTVTKGYAAMYALYAATDTQCTSAPQYASLYPLGTCIAIGGGTAIQITADVSTYYDSFCFSICMSSLIILSSLFCFLDSKQHLHVLLFVLEMQGLGYIVYVLLWLKHLYSMRRWWWLHEHV